MQLAFQFQIPLEATFDNFVAGNNQVVVDILRKAIQDQSEKLIYCWGEKGSGLTHLLHATCHLAHHNKLQALYFPMQELIHHSNNALQNLENLDLLCFDDVPVLAKNKSWEEGLFHCYNRAIAAGTQMIFTGNQAPHTINFGLQDLSSRLNHCLVLKLEELEDSYKKTLIQRYASTRGIVLSTEVEKYIFNHTQRDVPYLLQLLDALDKISLEEKHRITVPFVKRIIQENRLTK